MKRLLHCVFQYDGSEKPETIHNHRLAVFTSYWRDDEAPGVARLQAYERSIATLHATRTVVPFRFGCVMENPPQIRQMLDDRGAEFQRLLGDLDGLAEIGLRVWSESAVEEPMPLAPGARFLAGIRERHAGLLPAEKERAARIRESLAGLYVREKSEAHPTPDGRLMSLHFLVARTLTEDFRERLRHLSLPDEMKLVVSGPWPPYNFVDHA